jgi:hypothetical protein
MATRTERREEAINAMKLDFLKIDAHPTAAAILAVGGALICVGLDIRDAIKDNKPPRWQYGAR